MTTKQLVQINAIARWITGLGLFEHPLNRSRLLLSIFYAPCLISLYLYSCVEYLKAFFMNVNKATSLKLCIYVTLPCIQMASCFFILVNTWYHTKMSHTWCKQLDEIKMTMNTIGCRANDKPLMRFRYIFNIFIFLELILITYLVLQRLYNFPLNVCAVNMYCVLYTILVILLVCAEFNYSVRHTASLFGELNTKLLDMIPLRENQQIRVELDSSTESRHLKVFNTIRRLHLKLVRSSLYVNDFYALQNLVVTSISIITVAILLYQIYSLEIIINQIYHRNTMKVLFYLTNIIIINVSCTRTTEEIRQFTLQLIDSRLVFGVCGLFNLGRRLFTMIVNGIITYLAILIQIAYLQNTDTVDAGSSMPP